MIKERGQTAWEAFCDPDWGAAWSERKDETKAIWAAVETAVRNAALEAAAAEADEAAEHLLDMREGCDCCDEARASGKKYRPEGAWRAAAAIRAMKEPT
jgi:hypothetical protein